MSSSYLEILRPGINTTIQDKGRNHFYHIGITKSGAMDQRTYMLSNALVENDLSEGALEFAYQGPLLKLVNGNINFAITGDVVFKIIRKNSKIEEGECFKNYFLEDEDQIDIITTKKTVYGYLAIQGGFEIEKTWDSYSINTKAKIGPNSGEKFSKCQKIYIKDSKVKKFNEKKLNYNFSVKNTLRVIKGTNFNYFSEKSKINFFNNEYKVTKLSDRMGMRLEGPTLENIVSTNIKSEGLVKGVIQVPADGKPIILLSDHGTIGGYPKIAVVINADYDSAVQLIPETKIIFKNTTLEEAEKYYEVYSDETKKYLEQIK